MKDKTEDKIKEKIMGIKYDQNGLVPVIAQDITTKEVLMLAYANQEALGKSVETREAHYYSRSRKELWHKGATSGHIQYIEDIRYDCDADAVIYLVQQEGAACHTGEYTCFYRSLLNDAVAGSSDSSDNSKNIVKFINTNDQTLTELQQIIVDRLQNPKEDSYTSYLFDKGTDKILKKIGEESAEVIIAAKNNNKSEATYETADLIYHLTVLLTAMDLTWQDVLTELKKRG